MSGPVSEHKARPSKNVWRWLGTPEDGVWIRDVDGRTCPWSQVERVNAYDAKHPATGSGPTSPRQ